MGAESKFEEIILRKSQPLILNWPHRLNTIILQMVDELESAVRDVGADPAVRVVILSGAGDRAFSAGADLTSYEFSSPSKIFDASRRLYEVFSMFERIPKPVIASIRGYAFGGGLGMVSSPATLGWHQRTASSGSPRRTSGCCPAPEEHSD